MNQQPADAVRRFGEAAEDAWAMVREVEQRNAKRRQLESAVIEAAKELHRRFTRDGDSDNIELIAAVDDLIEFESVGEQE